YEYKFIDRISKDILKKLCDGPLHVGENLVGIDFHFDKLNLSRFVGSDKVNMIGICGISVIGKTTLAKAIYNLMYVHFEGSCFCEDVKEVTKRQGLIQVQLHMIGKIMKTEDVNISGVGEGIMVIKQRMACKPILLVLDDVDHRDQLKVLAGSASWFCPGSLIIFTDKDKQLLRSHRVDEIHDMKFLDEDRSLQLFSLYAFEEKHPSTGFQELAEKAVKYVQGHPLALIILGCFLYSKTVSEWVSELERLREHPNEEIHRVLRLSYDGLNLQQQNILLDIACLFIGEKSDFVANILDSCNFFADTNMGVLVDKLLIMISSNMSLQMHDLIQGMAREIIHEELYMTGGINRGRFGDSSEVYNVLNEDCKSNASRFLMFRVEMDALHVLNLTRCLKVDQLPEALGRIKSLTELHVDKTAITELPSFVSSLTNLESLSFGGQRMIQPRWSLKFSNCNLEQVPESIGGLSCLEDLFLTGNNFTSLPGSLSQLSHLERFYVDGCKKLEVLPELPPSVWSINASDCTSLREVMGSSKDPFSTENHVRFGLPSHWCSSKFRGFGTCVVFKRKKPCKLKGYSEVRLGLFGGVCSQESDALSSLLLDPPNEDVAIAALLRKVDKSGYFVLSLCCAILSCLILRLLDQSSLLVRDASIVCCIQFFCLDLRKRI
ncbi:NB-ARC domains-containing protein, partial [Tanacetum coccineum]